MSLSRSRTPGRRRSLTAAVLTAAAVGSAAGLAADVQGAAPAAADGRTFSQMLAALRGCESGGNYAIDTGNGYYGAYQFDAGTWHAVGGTGLPHQNPPAVQDEMATRLYEQRGWSPWPSCSRSQGLYPVPVERPDTGSTPFGAVDEVRGIDGGVAVLGWAVDRDVDPAPITVHVYVDAVPTPVLANGTRADVAAVMGVASDHGYSAGIVAAPGPHHVCVFALNQGPADPNPELACRDVVVPHEPVGAVDIVKKVAGGVRVSGWTLDLDSPATTPWTHIYEDGHFVKAVRGTSLRPDVARAYGLPTAYGYSVVVPTGSQVCVYGLDDTGAANNPLLGCRTPS